MLLVAFIFSALATFGLVFFLFRPSPDEAAVARRVAALKSPNGGPATAAEQDVHQYLKTLQRGSFGFLEDVVEGSRLQRMIQLLILQADKATSVGTVLMSCLGLAAIAGSILYFLTASLPIAAGAAVAVSYLPIGVLSIQKTRRVNAFNKELPDCIDMMARALRAGHSFVAAVSIVAEQALEPARTEFGEVFKKQNYGLPLREALMQLLDRVPSQDLRVLVTGVLVQKDTGGNLAEILDRILFVTRERMRLQGEIRTHTAQGRLTGWILCSLPVVMLVLINIVNPGYSNILFHDPLGKDLMYAGIALLLVGGFVIRKIINGIEV